MKRRKFIFASLALACAGAGACWPLYRAFGSIPGEEPVSPHWHNGEFHNLPDDYIYANLAAEPLHAGGWLKFLFTRDGNRYPPSPVKSVKINLKSLADGEFVWLGHSSLLLKLAGKFICIDPVLSGRASPLPFTIPAWPGSSPYAPAEFPFLDYLCISHDHWDHLDYGTVAALRYKQLICGKNVGAHFKYWGLAANPVELDWGGEYRDQDLKIVFTPSRHFSGRGLQRNKSLWGGFVLDAGSGGRIYFSGDGGYGRHFAAIGQKYGPFDIIFPDSGQYNRAWSQVHMFPEQAVQAALDTGSRLACPVHLGKFTLSWHPWNEPAQRFVRKAAQAGLPHILPLIGEKRSLAE